MIKPLYLLADSQLLFWADNDGLFSRRIRGDMETEQAAYIGASNNDDPRFYELFRSAMETVGVSASRMIPAQPSPEDMQFLEEAGLVLLAGGSVERGWRTIAANGVKEMVLRKRYAGAVLVGVSAGAVQLGLGSLEGSPQPKKLETFGLAPFYIGAHEEKQEWWDLRALVNLSQDGIRGVGLPLGAGAIYYQDGTLEPVRKTLVEFCRHEGELREHALLPRAAPINSAPDC